MSAHDIVTRLEAGIAASIVGQREVVRLLVLALLADGHCLLEGLPGLAKTRAVKAMANQLTADMRRVQFTPDLLPSDVTGSEVYHQDGGQAVFKFQAGPIFANLVLADEINRAPAKVQAALLEAMEERQVTVGGTTHPLPDLFLVFATQNPIEQEGTYPLPEAQLDRFLMHVRVDYPTTEDELEILRLVRGEGRSGPPPANEPIDPSAIFDARREVAAIQMAEPVERYIVDLVAATRDPSAYDALKGTIEVGASPRGTLALDRVSRARAWLEGRDHVVPDDVRDIAPAVLRHRIRPSYDAAAEGLSGHDLVLRLLEHVAVG